MSSLEQIWFHFLLLKRHLVFRMSSITKVKIVLFSLVLQTDTPLFFDIVKQEEFCSVIMPGKKCVVPRFLSPYIEAPSMHFWMFSINRDFNKNYDDGRKTFCANLSVQQQWRPSSHWWRASQSPLKISFLKKYHRVEYYQDPSPLQRYHCMTLYVPLSYYQNLPLKTIVAYYHNHQWFRNK